MQAKESYLPHTVTHADPGEWPAEGLEYLGRCPLCNSGQRDLLYSALSDRVFFVAPGLWCLHTCKKCGCAYLDPRPTRESINLAYQDYYTHAKHLVGSKSGKPQHSSLPVRLRNGYLNQRYGHCHPDAHAGGFYVKYLLPPPLRPEWDHHGRHLPRASLPHNRLLDIGCGDGKFIAVAERAGWVCEGIDPDGSAVSAARDQGLHVTQGNVNSLDLLRETYDVITMNHVIEHLHDPMETLNACHSVLRKGGLFWVATPNVKSLEHRRYQSAWYDLDPPRHLLLFNRNAMHQSLAKAGFKGITFLSRGAHAMHSLIHSQAILEGADPDRGPNKRLSIYLVGQMYEFLNWIRPQHAGELIVSARKLND